uniref:PGG domain-containing protein n=1 Tax=Aegilops tauschii TaxID=37682 RepID=M8AYV8_AEGTA
MADSGQFVVTIGLTNINTTRQDPINVASSRNLLPSSHVSSSSNNDDFELLWRHRKYLVLLGVLAVSVTYNAGLTPPGGSWTLNKDGHHAGDPVMHDGFSERYEVFFYCNAAAFAASLVLISCFSGFLVRQVSIPLENVEEARKFILMLVTFAATITYQAGLNPPGGFWAENDSGSNKLHLALPLYNHHPATSVLQSNYLRRYNIFITSNSTSFVTSLVIIILLLSPKLSGHGIRTKAMIVCVVVDLLCLIVAYAAGCCREVATSFYVVFIIVIVWISFAILAGFFVTRPVANWLKNVKSSSLWCVRKLGRALSLSFRGHKSRNAEQDNSYASNHQSSVRSTDAPAKDNTAQPQDQTADELPNIREDVSYKEHAPVEERNQISDDKEAVNNSQHLSGNSQQSANIQDVASNTECHSPDVQNVAEMDEDVSSSPHPAGNCQRSEHGMGVVSNMQYGSTEGKQDANMEAAKSSTEQEYDPLLSHQQIENSMCVSLAYQSGLNPPGGFWSRSTDHHSAADRILEDTHHRRFIAFFYLNAIAFVASIVMITLLLNKMASDKVTKRRALPITMIVVLLSLTRGFALGNCREAKKTIFISVLVCSVLAYVLIHVLIAIHIIPPEWRRQVAEMLEHSVSHFCSVPCQFGHNHTGGDTSEELGRRRNLLLTIAILAVTVTYQAGMNPPGGVWSDATGTPGNPILQDTHPKRYDVFYYSNSVSFVSSVVVTILLVNKESCEYGIKSYALRVCLVAGLLGLLIAYVAGSCRNIKQSIYLSTIAMGVLVSLLIQVLLSSMHDTLGKPLAKCLGFLHDLLFHAEGEQVNTPVSPEASVDVRSEASVEVRPEASVVEEEKVGKRHKYLMLLAILAASIAYQAGLNPPGGFWSDDKGHVPGNPVLRDINHRRFKIFFWFNSFAFMASIVVIMLLLSKSIRKKAVPIGVLHLIMILDMLALMTAFAAGSCRKLRTSVYVYALVGCVVVILLLLIIVTSAIAKYRKPREGSGINSPRRPEPVLGANTPARPEV